MFTCTAHKNQKLYDCFKEQLPYYSFSAYQKSLRTKRIRINGRPISKDCNVKVGDRLELDVDDGLLQRFLAPDLEIAFEDDNILVINKPQGVAVEDETGKPSLARWVRAKYKGGPKQFPAPCHRLETNTGGLVVFAKNPPALSEMLEAFKQRRVFKRYYCLVKGFPLPRVGEIRAPLVKDTRTTGVRVVPSGHSRGAMPALTRYRIAHTNGRFSFMEVNPVTDRTHQIRAHMAYINHPVVGDDKYGNREFNRRIGIRRQQLYLCAVSFEFSRKSVLHYLTNVDVCIDPPTLDLRKVGKATAAPHA